MLFSDTLIHRKLVASAIESSLAKKAFSTELVSEYVYFEKLATQKMFPITQCKPLHLSH